MSAMSELAVELELHWIEVEPGRRYLHVGALWDHFTGGGRDGVFVACRRTAYRGPSCDGVGVKLFYLAAIATLTFGFPLAMQPVFAQADQTIQGLQCDDAQH